MEDALVTAGLMTLWIAGSVVVICVCEWLFTKMVGRLEPVKREDER